LFSHLAFLRGKELEGTGRGVRERFAPGPPQSKTAPFFSFSSFSTEEGDAIEPRPRFAVAAGEKKKMGVGVEHTLFGDRDITATALQKASTQMLSKSDT